MSKTILIVWVFLFPGLSFAEDSPDCISTSVFNFSSTQLQVLVDRVSKCTEDTKLVKKEVSYFANKLSMYFSIQIILTST